MTESKGAVANRLIKLRAERNLSQDTVASAIQVSKSTYCRMEKDATFSADVLRRLLDYYHMTYEQFYDVKLPLVRIVSYPVKLLENLKEAVEKYGRPPIATSWGENRERYHKLKEALDPVLAERNRQIEIPDFKIDEMMAGQDLMTVKFDPYAEWLIRQCMQEQEKLIKAICG